MTALCGRMPSPPHPGMAPVTHHVAAWHSVRDLFFMAAGGAETDVSGISEFSFLSYRRNLFGSTKGTLPGRSSHIQVVEFAAAIRTAHPFTVKIYFAAFKNDGQALYESICNFLPGRFIDPGEGRARNIHDTRGLQVVVGIEIAQPDGFVFLIVEYHNLLAFR